MRKYILLFIMTCFIGISFPLTASSKSTHANPSKGVKEKQSNLTKRMFNSKGPIHIVSNRLDADNKKRIVIFSGNVVVKRSNLTLTCNKLTVYYASKGGEISKINAEGKVVIHQPPRMATCEKAIFFQKSDKVILIGSPVLTEGKNRVTGSKVTFFLDSDKTIIEGGKKGRVSTTIVPKSQAVPFKAKP